MNDKPKLPILRAFACDEKCQDSKPCEKVCKQAMGTLSELMKQAQEREAKP